MDKILGDPTEKITLNINQTSKHVITNVTDIYYQFYCSYKIKLIQHFCDRPTSMAIGESFTAHLRLRLSILEKLV
jgi:hypothetical protein